MFGEHFNFQLFCFHHLLQYILYIIYYYYYLVDTEQLIRESIEKQKMLEVIDPYKIRNLSTVTYNSVLYFRT